MTHARPDIAGHTSTTAQFLRAAAARLRCADEGRATLD
jgi:hypothetical protein